MKVDLLTLIKSMNNAKIVKIRIKPESGGKRYLFLDYYKNGVRQYVYPGLFVTLDPANRKHDELTIRKIIILRDQYESRVLHDGVFPHGSNDHKLVSFASRVLADKQAKNRKGYENAVASFLKVFPNVNITDIDHNKAILFRSRLSRLSPCTINHYLQAMGHICTLAVRDGFLSSNPFAGLRVKTKPKKREYLTLDEIQSLIKTKASNQAVKNAFLFSCLTGLRYGDVASLEWSQIQGGYLRYTQSKTGSHESILLPEIVFDLLGDPGVGKVFHLPSYKYLRLHLNQFIQAAGINKHITFHCARHTFATLQLTLGTDIYTVSKLLGHSDVKVTQIYAKIVDQKKDAAMSRMDIIKKPLG